MVLAGNQVINDGRVLGFSVQGTPGLKQILEFDTATNTWKLVLNAVGDITDASNEGAGEGLFIADVLGILQFKSLTNSADILLTGSADEIQIALSVTFLARITAIEASVVLRQLTSEKDAANGYAGLDADSIMIAQLVNRFTNTTDIAYVGEATVFVTSGVGVRDVYIKKIDADNEGVFTKIFKNGAAIEVQIA